MPTWTEVLDEMERRLAEADRALAGEAVRISPFEIPDVAERLPSNEWDRARAVLAATLVMEQRIEAEMGTMSTRLRARPSIQGRPAPTYFDRSA